MTGDPLYGYWEEDTRNNRCILRCDSGYEPSGCHIIRYSQKQRKWNHDVPSCQKGKDMSLFFKARYPPQLYKKQTHSFNKKDMSKLHLNTSSPQK